MIQMFYSGMFVSSLLCTAVYIYLWHKHYDVNFTMIFTLVPVACLGYVLQGLSESLEGLVRAVQIIYIGGCFLQLFILLSIFNLLPAPPLDGGRILAPLLCALLGSEKEERIGRILGFAVGFILCALGIVSALKGKGAAPLLPGLWLLLREDL